jgi:hypothetical protein
MQVMKTRENGAVSAHLLDHFHQQPRVVRGAACDERHFGSACGHLRHGAHRGVEAHLARVLSREGRECLSPFSGVTARGQEKRLNHVGQSSGRHLALKDVYSMVPSHALEVICDAMVCLPKKWDEF